VSVKTAKAHVQRDSGVMYAM